MATFLQTTKNRHALAHEEMIRFASILNEDGYSSEPAGHNFTERELISAGIHNQSVWYKLPTQQNNGWRLADVSATFQNGAVTFTFSDTQTHYSFSDQSARALINAKWQFRKY